MERLSTSEYQGMPFNLEMLLSHDLDLFFLEEPFTTEEIDQVVKKLPNDKSLWPGWIQY